MQSALRTASIGSEVDLEIHVGNCCHDAVHVFRRELVAAGDGEDEAHAELAAGDRQRAGDVVSIADEDQRAAFQIAESLLEGHQIGHRLAGMAVIGQAIDDRHRRPLGQPGHLFMLEGAGHDPIAHARQHAGHVLHRLARAQADFFLAQQQPVPPRWVIATAKLTRVRRLGFSKIIASVLPARSGSFRPGVLVLLLEPRRDVQQVLQALQRMSRRW